MKNLSILITVFILASCTTIKNTTNIDASLQASEYNSISSQYTTMPTFVQIDELTNGYINLTVKMDMYGTEQSAIAFGKRNADLHIAFIDKYLEWEALAEERGDILSKEIGEANSWKNDSANIYNQYQFHSGNKLNHYLVVRSCALGTCIDKPQYYDKPNAIRLKELLLKFKQGKIHTKNLDDVYR